MYGFYLILTTVTEACQKRTLSNNPNSQERISDASHARRKRATIGNEKETNEGKEPEGNAPNGCLAG